MLPFLSAKQLQDWQRFHCEHGISINRDDIHWGMLLSMFYNANRGTDAPALHAEDFMPYRATEEVEDTVEEFVDRIKSAIKRA